MIEFDPDKDAANIAKHGVSLTRAVDLVIEYQILDDRFPDEVRYRAYGQLDGELFSLAFTFRDGRVRAINLRRTRAKEFRRYAPK